MIERLRALNGGQAVRLAVGIDDLVRTEYRE